MNYNNSTCEDNLKNNIASITVFENKDSWRRVVKGEYFLLNHNLKIKIDAIKPYFSSDGVPFIYNLLDENGNIIIGIQSNFIVYIEFKNEEIENLKTG